MADAPVKLSNISPTLLPPTITEPIFNRATETSAVMQLARRISLSMTAQTAIPVSMDVPQAGWVNEGGSKPTGNESMSLKTMSGKKVSVLLPVSEEVARSNAAGLYSQIQADLPISLARAFDLAAIHGKTPAGNAGPFDDYLAETSNSVVLGSATTATGGIWKDIVNGEAKVIDDSFDVTGYVADPRLRPLLLGAVDNNGRPLMVDTAASLDPGAAGSRS
ncbi:phage major capsid protein, partial [Kitasatospora sp. NPDC003701]